MRILLSGGGSGGHVTPLKYVAQAIKEIDQKHEMYYIAPRNDAFYHLLSSDKSITKTETVFSGKWRRYSNETLLEKILDFKTNLLNARDIIYVCIGTIQCIVKLRRLRPDVILLKGGFVGVPVGIAAKLLHIPFVTHDSDSIAGLANRIVGRWAYINAVGQNHGTYPYGADKLKVVGVPINPDYTNKDIRSHDSSYYKSKLKFDPKKPLILVWGGSLGAGSINSAIAAVLPQLVSQQIQAIIISGTGKAGEIKTSANISAEVKKYIMVLEFESNPQKVLQYTLAADIVITRAGTTTISELSAASRASIIVPASQLGDQVANARHLKAQHAAVMISDETLESEPEILLQEIQKLLKNPSEAQKLGENLHAYTGHTASSKLARILTEVKQG